MTKEKVVNGLYLGKVVEHRNGDIEAFNYCGDLIAEYKNKKIEVYVDIPNKNKPQNGAFAEFYAYLPDQRDYKDMPVFNKGKNEWFTNNIQTLNNIDWLNNDKTFVRLTKNNASILKGLLSNKRPYKISEHIIDYLNSKGTLFTDWVAMGEFITAIDFENSTKAKNNQIEKLAKYIVDTNNFTSLLENSDDSLVEALQKVGKLQSGDGPKSLASKICKYLYMYLGYKGDGYFINDSVVRHVLPFYYREYCGVDIDTRIEDIKYSDLCKLLSDIKQAAEKRENCFITKDEMDCIMWYSYRNGK